MKKLALSILVCSLFSCSHKAQMSPFIDEPPADYSLVRSPEGPLLDFKDPDLLANYRGFTIPPVKIENRDSARVLPADPREINELAESLRAKMIRALGNKYSVFTQPVRNFAVIKMKLTNVWSDRGLTGLIPGSRLVAPVSGGATVEVQICDSVSGEVIGRMWDSRVGTTNGYFSNLDKWGSTEAVFDDWARIIGRKAQGG